MCVLSYVENGTLWHQTLRYDEQKDFLKFEPFAANGLGRSGIVDISDDGRSIVSGGSGAVQAYSVAYPSCRPNEVVFRLSINMNESPETVRWRLGTFAANQTGEDRALIKTIFLQDLSRSTSFHAWTVMRREICVPRNLLHCLGFQFTANFHQSVNGFAAYIIDKPGDVSLFANATGPVISADGFERVYHPASSTFPSSCVGLSAALP